MLDNIIPLPSTKRPDGTLTLVLLAASSESVELLSTHQVQMLPIPVLQEARLNGRSGGGTQTRTALLRL